MKKRFSGLLVLVLVLLCVSNIYAEAVSQETLDKVEQYINLNMDRFDVPGMSAVVVADGEVIYAKGFGVRKLGTEDAVDTETDFQIASVSKSFTALAIMQLQERGLLNVNDPVQKYLPWYVANNADWSKNITIHHLLQHTSGIPMTAYGLEIKGGSMDQLEEQVKRIEQVKLLHEPGSKHEYSNLNYWTLALIVEKVSGQKFADYMEENVFTPLEMTRSGYINKIENLDNVAFGHRMEKSTPTPFDYTIPGTTIAAGGVYTNALDMGNYLMALMNKGAFKDKSIIQPETWEMMTTNGIEIWRETHYGYGLRMMRNERGYTISHGGDNPNYTADLYILPEKNVGFAVMSNSQHTITHSIAWGMADILFGVEPFDVTLTRSEASDKNMAQTISYARYVLEAIMAIWLVIVVLGVRRGKLEFFKGTPSGIRLVLQVILLPIVSLLAAFFLYKIPISMIGSMHVAMLYKPTPVSAVVTLAITFVIFALFVGIMGFVTRKVATTDSTKSA